MAVRWDSTQVDGSTMRIYLGVPDRPGPHPGIVIAQHGSGVDELMQDAVHRLFREGYVVAAPELFHRQPVDMDASKRIGALVEKEIIADMNATVAHLKTLRMTVGPLGVLGFCMGGRVSFLMACVNPEFKACALFYGSGITRSPAGGGPSPLERASGIQCPVIGFFGKEDTSPSPEDMKKIDTELTRLGKWHEFHAYNDAGHAFQNFTGERYRERPARGSWEEMLAFFTLYLKRGGS